MLLFIHTVRCDEYGQSQLSVSLLPMAFIGTAAGFLIFNWHPAKIFMGSGAVYLGYTLGALSIIGGAKMATILLGMGLPALEVALEIGRGVACGKNLFIGSRGGLYVRFVNTV